MCAIPDKIFLCGLDDGHFKFEANYDVMNHEMRANKLGWKLTKKIDFCESLTCTPILSLSGIIMGH